MTRQCVVVGMLRENEVAVVFRDASKNDIGRMVLADIRESGVKVCCIQPEQTNTAMHTRIARHRAIAHLRDHMVQPHDVAAAVDFVLGCSDGACPTEMVLRTQRDLAAMARRGH